MTKFQPPKVPYVEAYHLGGKQRPTAIVLDLSDTTSDKGAALAIASQLHTRNAPSTSYHYLVDEAETYQGVWDRRAAFNSPYKTLNILVCGEPKDDVHMWDQPSPLKVVDRTAELVAMLGLAYRIPARYLMDEKLMSWEKHKFLHRGGIIVRIRGEWPFESFLETVHFHRDMLTRKDPS